MRTYYRVTMLLEQLDCQSERASRVLDITPNIRVVVLPVLYAGLGTHPNRHPAKIFRRNNNGIRRRRLLFPGFCTLVMLRLSVRSSRGGDGAV